MRVFEDAVASGEAMTGDVVVLYAYGLYLLNGGRKEDFMHLNDDDVQLMMSVHNSEAVKKNKRILQMFKRE